jgi:hypothetical protein
MIWLRCPDEQVAGLEHHRPGLLVGRLHRHEPHGRTQRRLDDGLRIGRIVLLWLPPLVQVAFGLSWLVIECVLLSGLCEYGLSRSRWPGW